MWGNALPPHIPVLPYRGGEGGDGTGALFPFSSAKTTKLCLVQDLVGTDIVLAEGARRLAWEGAISPEVGATEWDGDTWGKGSHCVWARLHRSPPRIRAQPVVSARGGGEGRQELSHRLVPKSHRSWRKRRVGVSGRGAGSGHPCYMPVPPCTS